jgi:REP-associated tyrosine transposase
MRHSRLPRVDLAGHTYFLACCVEKRRHLLHHPKWASAAIELYYEARARGDILLHAYVVMPDHYHVLLTLEGYPSISDLVRRLHSAFSRQVRQGMVVEGRVWQRRFYDHVIRDERDFLAKFGYIHDNPVLAGLVSDPRDYPWSSFHFWQMEDGASPCDGG